MVFLATANKLYISVSRQKDQQIALIYCNNNVCVYTLLVDVVAHSSHFSPQRCANNSTFANVKIPVHIAETNFEKTIARSQHRSIEKSKVQKNGPRKETYNGETVWVSIVSAMMVASSSLVRTKEGANQLVIRVTKVRSKRTRRIHRN